MCHLSFLVREQVPELADDVVVRSRESAHQAFGGTTTSDLVLHTYRASG